MPLSDNRQYSQHPLARLNMDRRNASGIVTQAYPAYEVAFLPLTWRRDVLYTRIRPSRVLHHRSNPRIDSFREVRTPGSGRLLKYGNSEFLRLMDGVR